MNIDMSSFKESERLNNEYVRVWGRTMDLLSLPHGISQDALIKCMRRAVETGDSVLEAYEELKSQGLV